MSHEARYAVYYAPALGSDWDHFGRRWLTGHWRHSALPEAVWLQLLRSPARYGFHATLKAPFRLAQGVTETLLMDAVSTLATGQQAVNLGRLELLGLDSYVALTPSEPTQDLIKLAQRCVKELDELRAPLNPTELAHRLREPLDQRALELLQSYGYPHVLERFVFHLTLASVTCTNERVLVMEFARTILNELNLHQLSLDRLCVFVEPQPGDHFERLEDFELSATVTESSGI